MAGHPSVRKRQKEATRRERQAEKLARRDERRDKRNDPVASGAGEPEVSSEGLAALDAPNADAPVAAPTGGPTRADKADAAEGSP